MKNCIMLWKNDAVDLAINNQRRAFSDAYNNEVLGIYVIILLAFFTLLINHCCQNDIYQNRHHTVHRIGC